MRHGKFTCSDVCYSNLHTSSDTFTEIKTRPLRECSKISDKQGFWDEKMQVGEILKPAIVESSPSTKIKVCVNRVGGKVEDDEENTTLPVMINKVESITILDSGAGVGMKRLS